MCLSHQLLPGQRWQNLRVQLHSQPGKALPACPCLSLPAWEFPVPVSLLPWSPRGCWDVEQFSVGAGSTSFLWHFMFGGVQGSQRSSSSGMFFYPSPQSPGPGWGYGFAMGQDLGIFGGDSKGSWLSSLGMKSFGVPPLHPEPSHELLSPISLSARTTSASLSGGNATPRTTAGTGRMSRRIAVSARGGDTGPHVPAPHGCWDSPLEGRVSPVMGFREQWDTPVLWSRARAQNWMLDPCKGPQRDGTGG